MTTKNARSYLTQVQAHRPMNERKRLAIAIGDMTTKLSNDQLSMLLHVMRRFADENALRARIAKTDAELTEAYQKLHDH